MKHKIFRFRIVLPVVTCFLVLTLLWAFSFPAKKKVFTIAILPDTQGYSQHHPRIFMSQTNWIAGNKDSIAFVLHLGDITNNNVDSQWTVAAKAMQVMDGKVPYAFVPGNHDVGNNGKSDIRNTELFNKYFPYDKYSRNSYFGGVFENGKMENAYHLLNAGGYNWLVLTLEFGPRDKVLNWAAKVVEKYPRHKVIIVTHAYMYSDDTRMSPQRKHKWLPQDYGLGKNTTADEMVNDGEQIWDKLVSRYKNIMLVFSGHVLNDGTGKLVSEGMHGNKVYQMLSNYQYGVDSAVKGGNGYLRLVTLDPLKEKINVKTYSPFINAYKTEPDQQFEFEKVKF